MAPNGLPDGPLRPTLQGATIVLAPLMSVEAVASALWDGRQETKRSAKYATPRWDPLAGALLVCELPPAQPGEFRHLPARPSTTPGLLDRARTALRLRHRSPRTEEAYLGWMHRYVEFHGRRDPAELGPEHVTAFLNGIAPRSRVSASTQNQALAALLFLYREVLAIDLPWLDGLVHAETPARLPVVLTRDEVRALLSRMEGDPRLMAILLYGCGLRQLECCRLRVKDVDFGRNHITVRRGKGDQGRATMLPVSIKGDLATRLDRVRAQHQRDLASGAGWVELPGALARKLPSVGRVWPLQWDFPATRLYTESESGQGRRHQLHETVLQQAVRRAVLAPPASLSVPPVTPSGTPSRPISCEDGGDIRTIQELLGRKDVATTMTYTHVLNRGPAGVQSPADRSLSG